MDCPICFDTYKEYELIGGGCCSVKICKNCIYTLKNCPMCRKKYFFIYHSQLQYYKTRYEYLVNDNIRLQDYNIIIETNLINKDKDNNDMKNDIINKEIKIKSLMDKIDELYNIININKNNKDLETVIKKYHLNII